MLSIQRKLFTLIVLGAVGIGFVGGIGFSRHQDSNSINNVVKQLINQDVGKPDTVDFSLFWQAWNRLHDRYVDKSKLDTQKLLYGAIQGMVNAVGDPYTVFFEPSTSKKFQEEISGAFSGVGMEIGKKDNLLTVIAPIKDSPAFKAGIKTGDRILKVDDHATADLSIEEAVNLIRGPKGTRVTLTISPQGTTDTKNIELVRENIKIPAVDWKLIGNDVAVIEIYSFNQNVDSEFKKAAQEIQKSTATKIIVDLRNNPGGLLDSAVNLAGWFLDNGNVVVIEDFGNGKQNDYKTSGDASLKKYQTVILINGGSASASEILAGALHDNREIKLIGEKSFGKGSVQQLENFSDNSSLKVTIAKWLTPKGISISEKGIQPDIKVEINPKDIESGIVLIGEPGKDPQLDKAVEELRK
ncbi:MAG TPA: S41 family peptidase [Candidatus Paceibacterota bacterium]|nr:S41 family peptidase [Candidatus Paceibacterota bacterium]